MPRRLHLTLVGTGDSESDLRRLAQELSLNGEVTFAGAIDHAAMPAVYREADIFALPSQSEGMSNALLEALASGLPVIVTPTDGALGLVEDGVQGRIVPWADVSALAEALRQLATNDQSRQSLGAASRDRALAFTWSHMAQQHLDLCRKITVSTKSSPTHRPASGVSPVLSSRESE